MKYTHLLLILCFCASTCNCAQKETTKIQTESKAPNTLSENEKGIMLHYLSEGLGRTIGDANHVLSKKSKYQKEIHKWLGKAEKQLTSTNKQQLKNIQSKAWDLLIYKGYVQDYTDIDALRSLGFKAEASIKRCNENNGEEGDADKNEDINEGMIEEMVDSETTLPTSAVPPAPKAYYDFTSDGVNYAIVNGEHAEIVSTSPGMKRLNIPATITDKGIKYKTRCSIMLHYDEENVIEEIAVSPEHDLYKSEDGVMFKKDMSVLLYYPNSKKDTTYKVPETVKTIGKSAFSPNVYLKNLILPEGLNVIAHAAFAGASQLRTINFPSTLKEIGDFVFNECKDITVTNELNYPPKTYNAFLFGEAVKTLITPKGTAKFYKTHLNWFMIENIVEK